MIKYGSDDQNDPIVRIIILSIQKYRKIIIRRNDDDTLVAETTTHSTLTHDSRLKQHWPN